jgi:ABC-type branched-subunit amino acid transport system ATPase component
VGSGDDSQSGWGRRRPSGSAETVIDVSGLQMRYGSFEAVRGIDLHVTRGEVFAFLGPNGAGKTTPIRIPQLLSRPCGPQRHTLMHERASAAD